MFQRIWMLLVVGAVAFVMALWQLVSRSSTLVVDSTPLLILMLVTGLIQTVTAQERKIADLEEDIKSLKAPPSQSHIAPTE